jgi:hypothetical protein
MGVIALLICCGNASGGEHSVSVSHLTSLPNGITLPVVLEKTLDRKHIHTGEGFVAKFIQRVPIEGGYYLPEKTELLGSVAGYDGGSLTISFTQIRLRNETQSVHVRLLAAAHWNDVWQTRLPVGGTDRSTSSPANWTTRQIGRDEIYRGGGYGRVYNRYSEPVGEADPYGVYASPQSPGGLRLAMGPFSTTATGLYGLPELEIASPGGATGPIVFRIESPDWQLHAADALLLEVVG